MGKKIDLTNKKFNHLYVLGEVPFEERTNPRIVEWDCLCDCGNRTKVRTSYLNNGHTKSCGCRRAEAAKENFTKDIKGIKLSIVQEGVESNYAYFPIVVEDAYGINRNELSDILKSHNIYSRKYFYPISNEFDCYEGCKGETPIAKDVSERVLALPLYPDLGMQNVERICKIIRERR